MTHESWNLAKAGETFGGTQSYGNGNMAPVVRYGAVSVPAASHASIIRYSSAHDTAAFNDIHAKWEKCSEGSRI